MTDGFRTLPDLAAVLAPGAPKKQRAGRLAVRRRLLIGPTSVESVPSGVIRPPGNPISRNSTSAEVRVLIASRTSATTRTPPAGNRLLEKGDIAPTLG